MHKKITSLKRDILSGHSSQASIGTSGKVSASLHSVDSTVALITVKQDNASIGATQTGCYYDKCIYLLSRHVSSLHFFSNAGTQAPALSTSFNSNKSECCRGCLYPFNIKLQQQYYRNVIFCKGHFIFCINVDQGRIFRKIWLPSFTWKLVVLRTTGKKNVMCLNKKCTKTYEGAELAQKRGRISTQHA